MKEYTFTAYCTFGKGDSGETYVDVELTDEESERLEHYGKQADIYYRGFNNCESLKELYDKIYTIAVEQMTEEMRDYGNDDNTNDPNWKVDDLYPCGVNFPREFEDELIEE
jgi:hypothetical protein